MKIIETKLPKGEIINLEKLSDGTWVVKQVTEENEKPKFLGDAFVLIEFENFSLTDEVMKYEPQTVSESKLKNAIIEAKSSGVKDFYKSKYDPSFDSNGSISFAKGKVPAVERSYEWWARAAKSYCREHNSRLGSRLEYAAFCGVLIKALVNAGNSVNWAWNAVCNDSIKLGHYWNSQSDKHKLELTGSRAICSFYDLANTYKILASDDDNGFYLASGSFNAYSYFSPIADISQSYDYKAEMKHSTGWIILS